MAERLQKFLAKSGIGSRRYCENLIKSNQITLNGKIAEIGSVVHQDDIIEYEGKIITYDLGGNSSTSEVGTAIADRCTLILKETFNN